MVDLSDEAVLREIARWRAEATGPGAGQLTATDLAARLASTPGSHRAGPALDADAVSVSRAIGRLVLAGSLAGADVTLMNQSWVVLR